MEQSVEEKVGPQVKKRKKRYCGVSSNTKKNAIRSRDNRSNETPEQREARLSHMRLLARLRRCSETKEEREQRLQVLRWYQKTRWTQRQLFLKRKLEPNISENRVTNEETTLTKYTTLQRNKKSQFDENSKTEELSDKGILKISNIKERNAHNDILKDYKTNKHVTFNLCYQEESMRNLSDHTNSVKRKSKRDFITECDGDLFKGFNRITENKANSKLNTYEKTFKMWLNRRKLFKNSIKTVCKTLDSDLNTTPILSTNGFQDVNKLNVVMQNSSNCKEVTIPFNDLLNISNRLNIEQTPIVLIENCKIEEKKTINITKSKVLNYKNVKNKNFKECNLQKIDFKDRKILTNNQKYDEQTSCRTVNMSNNDELNLRQLRVQIKCESYHLKLNNKHDIVSDESKTVSLPNTFEDPKCLHILDSTSKVMTRQSKPDSNNVSKGGKPRISLKPLSELM